MERKQRPLPSKRVVGAVRTAMLGEGKSSAMDETAIGGKVGAIHCAGTCKHRTDGP